MAPKLDFSNPNYRAIYKARFEALSRLRTIPGAVEASRIYYRDHVADFVNDWGVTVDPRNAAKGLPIIMPFVLFPKQREFVEWVVERWHKGENGVLVKSRDCGASWLAMSISITLCLFWRDITIGFGSAKEEKVDRSGDPDCLFYKGRMFLRYLPVEFKGQWDSRKNSSHMRLMFPDSESSVTGEAGDNIGRGGRKAMYWIDEFAVVERPKLVDANLIANTDTRIEMSTVQGTANTFAEHARGGLWPRFDFHYRYDPRKVDPETHELRPVFAEKKAKADPVVWAAEYECDFLASVEGIIIPQDWVQAAIGFAEKRGLKREGTLTAAYDVADRGMDKNAVAARHGNIVTFCEAWSGKGSDIFSSVERAFRICDTLGLEGFWYDGDGMGAGVRGDARKVNEQRAEANRKALEEYGACMKGGRIPEPPTQQRIMVVEQFRGSGAVLDPEMFASGTDRKNKDFFENYKAQSWYALRWRFLNTFRLAKGLPCESPDDWISIDPALPELTQLTAQISQPVWTWSKSGKMMIDKTSDDVASPNHADAVMMLFGYQRPPLVFKDELFEIL